MLVLVRSKPDNFESALMAHACQKSCKADNLTIAIARAKNKESPRSILDPFSMVRVATIDDFVLDEVVKSFNFTREIMAETSADNLASFADNIRVD